MSFDKLDNDELLRLALDAMNTGRDADSVAMLKTLLARAPDNAHALYLLAAQHAQMGLMERAEEGFRQAVRLAPELATARFQLGQLLLIKGDSQDAKQVLLPLAGQTDALGAYARGMCAAADDDAPLAIAAIAEGLALPQPVPALAGDMTALRGRLQALLAGGEGSPAPATTTTAPRFMGAYQTRD